MEHSKPRKYAEHYVKLELMKARLSVFTNDSAERGVDFIVKTGSGNYHDLSLQVVNLEKDRSVKIPKSDWNHELRDNLWIALVLLMKEVEPALYVIPSNVFKNPDDYIFVDNNQSEKFSHLSNWEIKVFIKAIPELQKYSLKNILVHFE